MDHLCQLNSDPYSNYLIPCKLTSSVHNICTQVAQSQLGWNLEL